MSNQTRVLSFSTKKYKKFDFYLHPSPFLKNGMKLIAY